MYNCIVNIKNMFDNNNYEIGRDRWFFRLQIVRSVYKETYVRKIAVIIAESL